MSFWSVAAPLFGVVLGGLIAGVAPIVADERRDRRQATREQANRVRDDRDAKSAQLWTATLEGVTAAQEALSTVVTLCTQASGSLRISGQMHGVFLNALKDATLAISRVFDDQARHASEAAANALAKWWNEIGQPQPSGEALTAAVGLADQALALLGEVRRALYTEDGS